jgi:DNA-binding response OmpR family regulator
MMENVQEGDQKRAVILIVDDEPDICTSLTLILRLHDYRVITAGHAPMALDILKATKPDLVISDFMMPWMNGRDFILEMKQRDNMKATPVIMMSAVDPGEPHPWNAYLRKPADVNELLATVRRLLDEQKAQQD